MTSYQNLSVFPDIHHSRIHQYKGKQEVQPCELQPAAGPVSRESRNVKVTEIASTTVVASEVGPSGHGT